jgi:hypothetical protein
LTPAVRSNLDDTVKSVVEGLRPDKAKHEARVAKRHVGKKLLHDKKDIAIAAGSITAGTLAGTFTGSLIGAFTAPATFGASAVGGILIGAGVGAIGTVSTMASKAAVNRGKRAYHHRRLGKELRKREANNNPKTGPWSKKKIKLLVKVISNGELVQLAGQAEKVVAAQKRFLQMDHKWELRHGSTCDKFIPVMCSFYYWQKCYFDIFLTSDAYHHLLTFHNEVSDNIRNATILIDKIATKLCKEWERESQNEREAFRREKVEKTTALVSVKGFVSEARQAGHGMKISTIRLEGSDPFLRFSDRLRSPRAILHMELEVYQAMEDYPRSATALHWLVGKGWTGIKMGARVAKQLTEDAVQAALEDAASTGVGFFVNTPTNLAVAASAGGVVAGTITGVVTDKAAHAIADPINRAWNNKKLKSETDPTKRIWLHRDRIEKALESVLSEYRNLVQIVNKMRQLNAGTDYTDDYDRIPCLAALFELAAALGKTLEPYLTLVAFFAEIEELRERQAESLDHFSDILSVDLDDLMDTDGALCQGTCYCNPDPRPMLNCPM